MKQPRHDVPQSVEKETKWDRIRKKCTTSDGSGIGSNAVKTEAMQRLIEKDYIGKRNRSFLQGDLEKSSLLNPALVMDMRHEMFQKIPRKLPLATVEIQNSLQLTHSHNIVVEERYINNELERFRRQLEKNRQRHKVKFDRKAKEENNLHVDNGPIVKSLEISSKHINDFYATPLDALKAIDQLAAANEFPEDFNQELAEITEIAEYADVQHRNEFQEKQNSVAEDTFVKKHLRTTTTTTKTKTKTTTTTTTINIMDFIKNEEDIKMDDNIRLPFELRNDADEKLQTASARSNYIGRRTPSPLTTTDEFLKTMREAASKHQAEIRRVRFEDEIEEHECMRPGSSCSNTSVGLDSIISDLAGEALHEFRLEEMQSNEIVAHIEPSMEQDINVQTEDKGEQNSELVVVGQGQSTHNKFDENNILLIKPIGIPRLQANEKNQWTSDDDDGDDDSGDSDVDDEDDEGDGDGDIATSVPERNRIIEQIFKPTASSNTSTLRKYFLKWIHYTTITKIERENMTHKNDRIHQINTFLDKLRKEKNRIKNNTRSMRPQAQNAQQACTSTTIAQAHPPKEDIQMTKKYHNKIKMQQDIIELQRLKLERQERLIMELKLKKISDEAKEARQEIKNELKAVIRSGDEKSKAKAKCLQLIGDLRDDDDKDDFKRLQGKSLLMPKFLQKMQERALERSIRHEQARQRRLQLEAEREAQKIAAEEAKRLEDEEAKRQRIEALKEKRRMEKMAKVLKEREHQRMLENRRKADEFCRQRLLRHIGMEGFKRLIERKRLYMQNCEALRRKIIMRNAFVAWRNICAFELAQRQQRADNLYNRLLLRGAIKVWRAYVAEERSKYFVAIDWFDMKLSTFMFKEWSAYTRRMKVIEQSKMRKAISHYEWNLKFKVLDCWQRLPQVLRLEKETEERRQRWRMKIWELLPDYTPRLDTFV